MPTQARSLLLLLYSLSLSYTHAHAHMLSPAVKSLLPCLSMVRGMVVWSLSSSLSSFSYMKPVSHTVTIMFWEVHGERCQNVVSTKASLLIELLPNYTKPISHRTGSDCKNKHTYRGSSLRTSEETFCKAPWFIERHNKTKTPAE